MGYHDMRRFDFSPKLCSIAGAANMKENELNNQCYQ